MKRFQFKLQAVLTLRQRAEHVALEDYSRAIRNRMTAAERFEESTNELSETRRLWLKSLSDGCPAVHAAQAQRFCHLLEAINRKCEQLLHQADLELNLASQRMLAARQQREAVEKFLERQRRKHQRDVAEEDRRLIEDIVNFRRTAPFSDQPAPDTVWN
jgi:flagellar FliJ protein